MTGRLDGTVALVTGASSGIGEATARVLAEDGAAVAVAARRRDRLEQLTADIAGKGGRALVIEADLSRRDDAVAAVERTVSELGRLDTVVNNAAMAKPGPVVGGNTEDWDRMVALNVLGVLHVAHAALPHLLAAAQEAPRGVADLVNISSVAGRVLSGRKMAVYSLTKAGIGSFSESLRQEVTGQHVRVSLVEPGVVKTEMLETYVREAPEEPLARQLAAIEPLEADDIADAVHYIVTRPRRVAVNEVMVRPTEEAA